MLPEPVERSKIKPTKIKPVGTGYVFKGSKLIDVVSGTPVYTMQRPDESIDKEDLFQNIVRLYQRKIDRLLDFPSKQWTATLHRIKPSFRKATIFSKLLFVPKTLIFRLDVVKSKWKLKRNKFTLKQVDTILFANFADEKERNDAIVAAMVPMI